MNIKNRRQGGGFENRKKRVKKTRDERWKTMEEREEVKSKRTEENKGG